MGNSDEIKIRALPRGTESGDRKKEEAKAKSAKSPRWIIYVGTASSLLLACTFLLHPSPRFHGKKVVSGKTDLASVNSQVDSLIQRHLQDAQIKRDMMMRKREMENLQFKDAINEPNDADVSTLPDDSSYGVQMDSEDSAEKVYDDLNEDPVQYSDSLPGDKINARLASRKWLNEQERAEKIAYISGFIRSAYDRGYEVEINQDLVVVGVKPISTTKTLNINQVIDRLAKQGL